MTWTRAEATAGHRRFKPPLSALVAAARMPRRAHFERTLGRLCMVVVVIVVVAVDVQGVQLHGPLFTTEPPRRIDFANSTGTMIVCSATGVPPPSIQWVMGRQVNEDGTAPGVSLFSEPVAEVASLRSVQVDSEVVPGETRLLLMPFRAEEYRQDVHAEVYRCIAKNSGGMIISGPVSVRGVVRQYYEVQVYDEYVIRGNTAVLRCHIPSFVRDYVKVTAWLVDDQAIFPTPNDSHYTVTSSGELHILRVDPVDGTRSYRCKTVHRLTNETQISVPSRVIVTDPQSSVPPRITHSIATFITKEGDSVYLPCVAQGYPVPTYRWFRERGNEGGSQMVAEDGRVSRRNGLLFIQKSRLGDAGSYACAVNNSVGEDRADVQLQVTAPLGASVQPREQEVDAGKMAIFQCEVLGHPVTSVTWYKDGVPLTITERIRMPSREVIEIEGVRREDAGMYQCFVENDEDTVQATAELKLGDAAPVFDSVFTDHVLHPGVDVSLSCISSGNPPPNMTWTLDGSPLPDTRRLSLSWNSGLTGNVVMSVVNVTRIRVEDGGEYACKAVNRVGFVEHRARINVHGLPYIRPFPNLTVVAGESLAVPCRVAGFPIEAISWERDGVQLPANLRQKVFPNGTLLVERVERPLDVGRYTCSARTAQGQSARRNLWLVVMGPPKIDRFSFPKDLREGLRTRISCIVSDGDLPISITWRKDGRPLPLDIGLDIRNDDEFSSAITFRSVSSTHSGNYTCVASNAAATVNHSAELLVHVPPRWIRQPEDVEVLSGQPAILHCGADGFPKPRVAWLKGKGGTTGQYSAIKNSKDSMEVFENGSLAIHKTSKEHRGFYMCQANNGIGAGLSKVLFLKVNVAAYFDADYVNYTVEKDTQAVLRCNARGDQPIRVSWTRNKERIYVTTERRLTLKEHSSEEGLVSELVIQKVETSDAALYGCVATNPFGHDEATIEVIVQELPGPPGNLKVTEVSSRHMKLSWVPGKTGNSIISKYIVKYRTMPDGSWTNSSVEGVDMAAVVDHLVPGASYRFYVVAVNIVGASPPSESVDVTCTEEIPGGAPLAVEAKAVGADAIKVTWKSPKRELWNGEILGYYVGYKIYDNPEPYVYKTVRVATNFKEELYLTSLRKFTKYSVVVQAFNRMGSGPDSDEVIAYTLEDVPGAPPQNIQCTTLTSQSVHVSWNPPPPATQNGLIRGYKVHFGGVDITDESEGLKLESVSTTKTTLHGLHKYTNYSIQILAFTRVGEGLLSKPIHCRTNEDVPGPPADIKALVMSSDAIIVTWKPPVHPNGIILKFTLYMRLAETGDHHVAKHILSSDPNLTFEARGLKENQRYEFWVTASTVIGEGESTKVVTQTPKTRVPSRISSFSDRVILPYKESVRLPCRIVGIPTPRREWKLNGINIEDGDERLRTGQDGALIMQNLQSTDSGNYSCHVTNAYGKDDIVYSLVVKAPPISPSLDVVKTTSSSIMLSWKPAEDGGSRVIGYFLSYKRDFGEWEEVQVKADQQAHSLGNLHCGSRYQLYLTAYNRMGSGQPSPIVAVNTEGSAPLVATQSDVLEPNSTHVLLRLDRWPDGGCQVLYFVVQYRPRHRAQWTLVSNNIQSTQPDFIITDLHPASWYSLQITAHNDAGSTVAEFDFKTLNNHPSGGGVYDPDSQWDSHSDVAPMFWQLNILVPLTASVTVIVIAVAAVCLLARKRKYRGYQHGGDDSVLGPAKKAGLGEKDALNNMPENPGAPLQYATLQSAKTEEGGSANADTKSTKSTKSSNSKNHTEELYPGATFSLPNLHNGDPTFLDTLRMRTFYKKDNAKGSVASVVDDGYAETKKRNSSTSSNQDNPKISERLAAAAGTTSVMMGSSPTSRSTGSDNSYHSPRCSSRKSKDYATLPLHHQRDCSLANTTIGTVIGPGPMNGNTVNSNSVPPNSLASSTSSAPSRSPYDSGLRSMSSSAAASASSGSSANNASVGRTQMPITGIPGRNFERIYDHHRYKKPLGASNSDPPPPPAPTASAVTGHEKQHLERDRDLLYHADSSSSNESLPPHEERRSRRPMRRRYSHMARHPFSTNDFLVDDRWSMGTVGMDVSSSSLNVNAPLPLSDSQEFSAAECDRDIILQYRREQRFSQWSNLRLDQEDDGEDDEEDDEDEEDDGLFLSMAFHRYHFKIRQYAGRYVDDSIIQV